MVLENACSGIVSCADSLVVVARDDVVVFCTCSCQLSAFSLNVHYIDCGHTIGISVCSAFPICLYNFTGKGDADPKLDSNYVTRLKFQCKLNGNTTCIETDLGSARTFDIKYFKLIPIEEASLLWTSQFLTTARPKRTMTSRSRPADPLS